MYYLVSTKISLNIIRLYFAETMSQKQPATPPEPKFVLRDGMGPVSCIDFGLDETLYAGTQDGWIHFWDLTVISCSIFVML